MLCRTIITPARGFDPAPPYLSTLGDDLQGISSRAKTQPAHAGQGEPARRAPIRRPALLRDYFPTHGR